MKRLYCTISEVIEDLSLAGCASEAAMMKHIRAASKWVDDGAGMFLPYTAAQTFKGSGFDTLFIPPLLSASSITVNGVALAVADYDLLPLNKHWENGPYTCLLYSSDGTIGEGTIFDPEDEIIITGTWGLFSASELTGQILPALMAIGDTSFVASDGSKFSPGMTMLIEAEQILITATGAVTSSTTTTNGAIDASVEIVTVADGSKVNVGEIAQINFEMMKVADKQTNDLSVKRGWNRTTRATHLTGQTVYVQRTYSIDRGCNGTTAAAHAISTPISRMLIPDDVNYLAREVAALMLKKAESGFAGRIGNTNTGETFYFNELPKDSIDRILGHYRIVRA